jgi:hypothetical protein
MSTVTFYIFLVFYYFDVMSHSIVGFSIHSTMSCAGS